MRWDDFRRSDNIEDRRGEGEGGLGGGYGGGLRLPGGAGGMGIGGIVVVCLIGWALGIDPSYLLGDMLGGGGYGQQQQAPPNPNRKTGTPQDQMGNFVAAIIGDTEDRWKDIFAKSNRRYAPPVLVLFNRQTDAPCGGVARSATGPFYCPADKKIYIDTSFFADLEQRFKGCSGNACRFSQAYVLAHEVGHHVQNELGILPKAQTQQRNVSKVEGNHIQVQVELQADCFAGIWANQAQAKHKFIDAGDVDAALQTASAIGDDRLQRQSQGRVVPDAFTHGSSAQRMKWFKTGFTSGSVQACNTFGATQL